MNTASINNPPQINTCLYGQGIVCGLTVHVNEKCDVELGSGTAITASGTLIEIPNTKFDYYQKTPSPAVSKYFPHTYDAKNRTDRAVLELIATGPYNPKLMDSLKQQNPKDSPTRELLTDKIMVILFNESNPKEQYFLLVSPALLLEKGDPAILNQIKGLSKTNVPAGRSGIFARPKATTVTYSTEVMDAVFHPHLQLLEVHVPRFGYKTLGIADLSKPFGVKDNFVNPFTKISKFAHIFNEYKAILDDLIPEFDAALEKLHTLYGNQLTHKGKDYWAQYRKILREKWLVFLEQGDYLFYIQYYYDWLTDLVKAYEELCEQLSAFNAKCLCDNKSTTNTYGFLNWDLFSVVGRAIPLFCSAITFKTH